MQQLFAEIGRIMALVDQNSTTWTCHSLTTKAKMDSPWLEQYFPSSISLWIILLKMCIFNKGSGCFIICTTEKCTTWKMRVMFYLVKILRIPSPGDNISNNLEKSALRRQVGEPGYIGFFRNKCQVVGTSKITVN